jgi:hypothetical protein
MALVDEVTKWPNYRTDDTVMAHWMYSYQLQRHLKGVLMRPANPPQMKRPGWLSKRG